MRVTLTPERIDSLMAQLGGLLFDGVNSLLVGSDLEHLAKIQIDHDRTRIWEQMKSVAEQAKKASVE